jgi:hypothetical protein
MNLKNAVIDIKPKKFELTAHLLDESLPKKLSDFKNLSHKKRELFAKNSFSRTGICQFSSLPSMIKNKWVCEGYNERYFRFDERTRILYVCFRKRNKKEVVIGGYDFRTKDEGFNFGESIN